MLVSKRLTTSNLHFKTGISLLKADSDISSSARNAKAVSEKSNRGPGKTISDAASVKLVMAGSGCEDTEKVEQVNALLLVLKGPNR